MEKRSLFTLKISDYSRTVKALIKKTALFLFSQMVASFSPISGAVPQSLFTGTRVISEISIVGNYKTNRAVILSELLFKEGSTIEEGGLLDAIVRSKENLQNTSLFNLVEIEYYFPTNNTVGISINVEERWYIWVFPLFEAEGRNFADFLKTGDKGSFNYGLYLKHDNFRGHREQLKLRFITGYKTQTILEFIHPAKNQQSGWGAKAVWYMYDKMAYSTKNDQQLFIKTPGDQLLRETSFHWTYLYRYNLDHHHSITFSYFDIAIADTLQSLNPQFLPDEKTEARTLDVEYIYKFDRRNSKIYPLNGYHTELSIARKALSTNGSYAGFSKLELDASYQRPLFHRFYGKVDVRTLLTDQDKIPYFYKAGLGYKEYLNGYEYKVIDGTSFGALKTKLIYELVPRRDLVFDRFWLRQFSRIHYAFYLKLNVDVGYVYNKFPSTESEMVNTFLLGWGPGLDLVTIYDQIWSINYSFNIFGEHGFFFHLNLIL